MVEAPVEVKTEIVSSPETKFASFSQKVRTPPGVCVTFEDDVEAVSRGVAMAIS